MADPYINPNQAVVRGNVDAVGQNSGDAPPGKKVKGKLVPGTVEAKKASAKKAEPEPEPVVAESVEPAEEPTDEAPKPHDTKAEWVEFAVSQGASREEAENLTKNELVELYGG